MLVSFICIFHHINAAEIVVNTNDSSQTSTTGRWKSASVATMPHNGNLGLYTQATRGISTFTFTPTLPEKNTYTVEVFNACQTPRSHNVKHVIVHANGTTEQLIEQDCDLDPYVGQWRTLGNFEFNAGNSGSLTIDSSGSGSLYVGVNAARFIYQPTDTSNNNAPELTPSVVSLSVSRGDTVFVSAQASDVEDGDLTNTVQWSALGQLFTGESFEVIAGSSNFDISLTVTDSNNTTSSRSIQVSVAPASSQAIIYDFSCESTESLPAGFIVNNADALPDVGMKCGRYNANLMNNSNNKTLHYNRDQGRFDGVLVDFPFKVIARNIGIAPINQPTLNHQHSSNAYIFSGLQVHHSNFSVLNSAHLVAGQRGSKLNTIEGKSTLSGVSVVSDIGGNRLPNGRADLMIEGLANGQLLAYWQVANSTPGSNDDWQLYNGTGEFPGTIPNWDGNQVYVGLITYAQGSSGVPFMGVADSLEILE